MIAPIAITSALERVVMNLPLSRYLLSICVGAACRGLRWIAAADRRAGCDAANLRPRNARRAWHVVDGRASQTPRVTVRLHLRDEQRYRVPIAYTRALVGTLYGFRDPTGLCVDRANDVYVMDFDEQVAIEFAHGATTPIKILHDTVGYPYGCAVDSKTGDVAVVNLYDGRDPSAAS